MGTWLESWLWVWLLILTCREVVNTMGQKPKAIPGIPLFNHLTVIWTQDCEKGWFPSVWVGTTGPNTNTAKKPNRKKAQSSKDVHATEQFLTKIAHHKRNKYKSTETVTSRTVRFSLCLLDHHELAATTVYVSTVCRKAFTSVLCKRSWPVPPRIESCTADVKQKVESFSNCPKRTDLNFDPNWCNRRESFVLPRRPQYVRTPGPAGLGPTAVEDRINIISILISHRDWVSRSLHTRTVTHW